MSWEAFSPRLDSVEAGDLRSLFKAFEVFGLVGHKLRRSMLRGLTQAMKAALEPASLDELQMPTLDTNLMLLTLFFPGDALCAFAAVNVQDIGRGLGRSLPRHWRTLCELSTWADQCGSDVCEQIIRASDIGQLEQQARRYGLSNRYDLRLLLHFIRQARTDSRRSFATNLRDLVRLACEPRDSEARFIITAYQRLDGELGAALAVELGIIPEEINQVEDRESIEATRQEFRAKDATSEDYEIDLGYQDEEPESHESKSNAAGASESKNERGAIQST